MNIACQFVVTYDEGIWKSLQPQPLVDVVTGGPVQEPTEVKVIWDADALYIRFDCKDDYAVADYTKRDDPLYDQDVVEVFIDEEGTGRRYIELEISPANVIFDAIIENEQGRIKLQTEWDADGMETTVETDGAMRAYTIKLPFTNFSRAPQDGTAWRINFYRIDEDRSGKRHFQAWSPTGAVDYHIPSRFGTIAFTNSPANSPS